MRTELPACRFKQCKHQLDGNCTSKIEYARCSYIHAVETIEAIMGTQKYCALCDNVSCKNANTQDSCCRPAWNGLSICR